MMLSLAVILVVQVSLPTRVLEPSLTIAGEGEGYFLTRVGGLRTGPQGRLYVSEAQQSAILIFDSSGRHVRTIGGRGTAPGQFQGTPYPVFFGDSIAIVDQQNLRITYLSLDGSLLGTMRSDPVLLPDGRHAVAIGLTTDRQVVALPQITSTSARIGANTNTPLAVAPLGGGHGRIIASLTAASQSVVVYGANGSMMTSSGGLLTLRPDVQRWAVHREGGIVTVAPGDPPVLLRITTSGDTVVRTPLGGSPARLSARVRDSLIESFLSTFDRPNRSGVTRRDARRVVDSVLGDAEFYPPVSRVWAGGDGTLWVAREAVPGQATWWEVFGAIGEPLFRVSLPFGTRFVAGANDHIWLEHRDVDDVPTLRRYALR